MLLKIVWFQVVADDLDDSLAMSYLDRLGDLEKVPDWGRALLGSGSEPAVDVGHRFCESTIALEFGELKSVLEAEGDKLSSNVPLSDVFNRPVGTSVAAGTDGHNSVHVVGLDLFKDIAERHIMFEAWQVHFWLKNRWGVPDEDAKFVQQMKRLFQGVRHEQYLTLFLNAPESSSFPPSGSLHDDLADIPPSFALHVTWPHADCERMWSYFAWGIPFGAPLDMKDRCTVTYNAHMRHRDNKVPSFQDLMPLAPDSYTLASWVILLNQDQHIPNTEKDERALLERFFDYNTNALGYFRSLADHQTDFDDATREEMLRKQAALDPDEFYNLGDLLMAHGKEDAAVDAYRQGAARGNDLVVFANSIQPLVEYDFNHGQQDEAETMAKKAADVYSSRGIETYVWLLCKLNRYDEAEDWTRKLQERYGGDAVACFYAAHADHFPDQFAAEVKKRFPDGLTSVSLADFSAPPKDGCVFQTNSPELELAGLHPGDVVVGLDSHRVSSQDTYSFIRAMSDAPVMDLIVWHNGRYSEVKASPPNRRFGNSIGDYSP